jgi:hopanoid biosynthesis associated protein HpnK
LRGLIITADDFGTAVEVNEAVERAYRDGVLTAASLMVGGPAAADAVERARRMPGLRVGLHLVLVEGRPVLPSESIPTLVADDGAFRRNMVRAGLDMFFRPRARRELAMEVEAQFQAFAATGLELDHANAHKHFHLHPTVAESIVLSGRRYGLKAIRVPQESNGTLRAIDRRTRWVDSYALAPFCLTLRARLKAAGFLVPDRVFGIAWSGSMTREKLRALIERLPEGLNEVYLHPALRDEFPGAVPGYRYRQEFEALVDPGVITAVRESGAKLGGFADFLSYR